MAVTTVSTSPVGTFHVVPPPPPRPRQWSEKVIAIVLALLLNTLLIAPFLLPNPAPRLAEEPSSITVDLITEEQAALPQQEVPEEPKPLPQQSFTRSGGDAEAPLGPEAEDEPAASKEASPAPAAADSEPQQGIEKEKETTNYDIPEWARTVDPGYSVIGQHPALGSAGGGDPYLNAMWERVEQNLVYPKSAGGRVGVARFALTLHRSGRITALSLLTSSGHPDLDRAALDAIRRSAPFRPFPLEIPDNAVSLVASIPVYPKP